MQDILKEYGPAIITVVSIVALIGLISFLIGTDAGSVVGQAFSELISGFFRSAESAGGIMGGASAGSVNSAIDIALSSGGG
ncbi:MAG: hypothetical protein ILP08_04905 [Lachnospiraceae bacterium]|nr:hypothetical protein [Lachnospiraceae bacterium]MBQ3902587.1 hypothetical protein [Lachnospiraceae bacterium]